MADPTRWGNAPRLTRQLREGHPGIPAIPLYRPFAGWVARGWRREKYLSMHPAAGGLLEIPHRSRFYYLYATAGCAPEEAFYDDADDLLDLFNPDDSEIELARRRNDPASQIKSAVVGIGVLGFIEDDDLPRVWEFTGGVLLPEPIPLDLLVNRPYGGVFYPFGREVR